MSSAPLTHLLAQARTDIGLRRRLQSVLRFAIRQRLPVIESPTEAEAERHAAEQLLSHRTVVVKDEHTFLVAADGTYQLIDTDPYRGLRAVAAGEVLGLTRTHSLVEVKRGMIVVTLVQPSRRDRDSIRMAIVRKLLLTGTDGEFDSQAAKSRATKAEKHLAQRVQALRGVGSHSAEDWEIRRRVGVTITEIRSR